MDSKHIPALGGVVLSCIAFASGNFVIGTCLALAAILLQPDWIAKVGEVTGFRITGLQKAGAVTILLAIVAGMIFWNGRVVQQKTDLRHSLVARGDSLMTVARSSMERIQPDSGLNAAKQAYALYRQANLIDAKDSVQLKSRIFIQQATLAMSQVASAKNLNNNEFLNQLALKSEFQESILRYRDTALREQELKRPGMAKVYAARKAAARREQLANEKNMREQAIAAAKAERVEKIAARRAYAKHARNVFLDGGMDIEVTVAGKNADVLNMSYALFSAVWARKIETEGLQQQWRDLGFRRVNLTDNYDYNVYYDLK